MTAVERFVCPRCYGYSGGFLAGRGIVTRGALLPLGDEPELRLGFALATSSIRRGHGTESPDVSFSITIRPVIGATGNLNLNQADFHCEFPACRPAKTTLRRNPFNRLKISLRRFTRDQPKQADCNSHKGPRSRGRRRRRLHLAPPASHGDAPFSHNTLRRPVPGTDFDDGHEMIGSWDNWQAEQRTARKCEAPPRSRAMWS
jgi:hypothetical protein